MKQPHLKFDFPDLEEHEALWLLSEDLEAAAYYLEDGRIVGVRNPKLSARYIDMRLQALRGMARAFRTDDGRDPGLEEADPRRKRRGR